MTREQLAHLLRAASSITEERDIVVIGSQAILGSFPETSLPDEAISSIEADLTFFGTGGEVKADLVDGAIGELSPFHETHGIYAQGVSLSTAIVKSVKEIGSLHQALGAQTRNLFLGLVGLQISGVTSAVVLSRVL